MCVDVWAYFFGEKSEKQEKAEESSPHALYLISLLRETFVILNKSHLWFSGDITLKSKTSSYFECISDMLREGVCI